MIGIGLKSSYSNILMILCAILAFVPVLSIDYILDGYVRSRETASMQKAADDITTEAQNSVYDGLKTIQTVLNESPSLCTPTFQKNLHAAFRSSDAIREFAVENTDGVQYCTLFGEDVVYSPLSETLTLPGKAETLAVVSLQGHALPVLQVTRIIGTKRASIFVLLGADLTRGLPNEFWGSASLRLSLTNGTPILTLGNYDAFSKRTNDQAFITVNSFASGIPIRLEAAVPFADVRANYADLGVGLMIVACLLSAGFLLMALQYVRRSKIPAFDLESAIISGELRPFYQPVINLVTGQMLGCEVLVRWVKRNGEIVPPSSFIDYAEVTGLAIPMTVQLMQRVKAELSELCTDVPDLKISINLFEGHFRDNTIVEDVQAIFGGSQIKFRQLVFEITERRPFSNNVQAISVIAGLHSIGARLALDDVGTGHSNLAYVQTLGVDVIKIDQVFVDMIKADTKQVPVLDGLIAMARDLGAEIVAEGVETEAQAIYLRDRGVVQAQGFLFAPALKPESFLTLARALNAKGGRDKDAADDAVGADASTAA